MKAVSSAQTSAIIWVDTPEQLAAEREQVCEHLKYFGANTLVYEYDEYGELYPLKRHQYGSSQIRVSDDFFARYQHALDRNACTLTERDDFERDLDSLVRIKRLAHKHNIEVPS